ncbi:MAG: BON domain-containing protein [Actinomycetota bacterium]
MDTAHTTQARSDTDIQHDVLDELDWTPDVNPAHIGVSVNNGVVTLSGEVSTFAERVAAKDAAVSVRGVTGLADELEVETVAAYKHTDTQIAEAIVSALRLRTDIPRDTITCEVSAGFVTLNGQVAWNFQRDAARHEASRIVGVRLVTNKITLSPRASASDTAERIRKALVRSAQVDADGIVVHVDGSAVRLTGYVRSWAERQQAATAAWASPNVTTVDNDLAVKA